VKLSVDPDLGIVVPVHNEQDNVVPLYTELKAALDPAGISFELLFVDDGSRDDTANVIRRLASSDKRVKALVLTRNFGHQAAISIGLEHVSGWSAAIMDGDLQDSPADLVALYRAHIEQSADVAYAVRRTRQENVFKRTMYSIFYRILARLARIEIPLDSGDFCVMTRSAVDRLRSLPERLRFVRGLRSWIGGKQIAVEVDRAARRSGQPKYTISKLMRLAIDGLVSFSDTPLRVASVLGFGVAGLSLLGIVVVIVWSLTGLLPTGAGLGTIALSILFLGGVQLVAIGIVGEYVGRIFEEVKRRPVAFVLEHVGGEIANRAAASE
jgi:dolichol-phosphate mannosyltransferase